MASNIYIKITKKYQEFTIYFLFLSLKSHILLVFNSFREFNYEKVFGEVIFGGRSINENLESLGINRNRCLVRNRKVGGATGKYWRYYFHCNIFLFNNCRKTIVCFRRTNLYMTKIYIQKFTLIIIFYIINQ